MEVVSEEVVEWTQSRVRDMIKLESETVHVIVVLNEHRDSVIVLQTCEMRLDQVRQMIEYQRAMYIRVNSKLVVVPGIPQIAPHQNHILDGVYL